MKHLIPIPALAVICAVITLNVHAENQSPGYVDFGKFSPSATGGEFVEVNVKSNLISMVARLTQKDEPEIAQLLRGLQQVRVNVIGLNDENRAEIENRLRTIRGELETQGWESIVTAQEKNQDVRIYLKIRGDEAVQGLVVTVLEGKKEAVLINIVGDIKPEKLAEVGEQFNIDPLKKIGLKLKKQAKSEK
ncbi:MAG: DUF4252 domain-containing protein [Verrucomicrobiota bacterium]